MTKKTNPSVLPIDHSKHKKFIIFTVARMCVGIQSSLRHGALLGRDSRATDSFWRLFPSALQLTTCVKPLPSGLLERSEVKIMLELRLN